eukprot:2302418-Prymnesium_polylepis.1
MARPREFVSWPVRERVKQYPDSPAYVDDPVTTRGNLDARDAALAPDWRTYVHAQLSASSAF